MRGITGLAEDPHCNIAIKKIQLGVPTPPAQFLVPWGIELMWCFCISLGFLRAALDQ